MAAADRRTRRAAAALALTCALSADTCASFAAVADAAAAGCAEAASTEALRPAANNWPPLSSSLSSSAGTLAKLVSGMKAATGILHALEAPCAGRRRGQGRAGGRRAGTHYEFGAGSGQQRAWGC